MSTTSIEARSLFPAIAQDGDKDAGQEVSDSCATPAEPRLLEILSLSSWRTLLLETAALLALLAALRHWFFVLRHALQDPDAAVRVLAATVAAKLHGNFTRTIGDRQAAADATPELAHNWRQLAEARLAYATSELLDPARARMEIDAATSDLWRAADIDPYDRDRASSLDRVERQLAAWRR